MDFSEARKARETEAASERSEPPSLLSRVSEGLHLGAFLSVGAAVVLSPVCFASWEMWWFWPMAGLIFLGCLLCGAGALVESALMGPNAPRPRHRHMPLRALAALALCIPFLLYALVRACFPSGVESPLVAMECERSLLLFFTPVAIALVMLLSSRPAWRHALLWATVVVAVGVSALGLWSHFATNDTQILWAQGTDFAYTGRLSGTFFCPNHYSAYANLFICLLLGAALSPRVGRMRGILFTLGALAFAIPNFLSLSRGGFGSLLAGLALALPIVGLRGRAPWKRVLFAIVTIVMIAGGVAFVRYATRIETRGPDEVSRVIFVSHRSAELVLSDGEEERGRIFEFRNGKFDFEPTEGKGKRRQIPVDSVSRVLFDPRPADRTEGWNMSDRLFVGRREHRIDLFRFENGVWTGRFYNPFMNRLSTHSLWTAFMTAGSWAELRELFSDAFWFRFDRGQYIGSALRAWRSNPLWGIGPGQHSNRWAEFEASDDGVRPDPSGDPAKFKRPRQCGYYRHLYEVHSDWTQLLEEYGVIGVTLFLLPLVGVLWILAERQRSVAEGDGGALPRSLPLGALLYCIVLILHSFGDFSLQMPCLVWLLAFVLSSAVLENGLDEERC